MPVAPTDKDVGGARRRSKRQRHAVRRDPPKKYTRPASARTEAASGQGYPKRPATPPAKKGGYRGSGKNRRYVLPSSSIPRGDAGRRTTATQQAAIDKGVRDARVQELRRTGRGSIPRAVSRLVIAHPDRKPLTPAQIKAYRVRNEAQRAQALAPVLTVLEQLSRPVHAVAAAAREDVRDVKAGRLPVGQGSLQKAKEGFTLKDKSLFSDVLKEAGVKNKTIAGIAGFGLDVALDPLTYLTLGGSSAASSAARSAARGAERKAARAPAAKAAAEAARTQALKRGATPRQAAKAAKAAARTNARRAGARAGAQAAEGKATNTGLDIRFAGQSIPGVARGTAAAKRAPRAVADRTGLSGGRADAAQQSIRDTVRSAASEFNPAITPAGVDKAEYDALRRAARTARAGRQRGDVYAALQAQSFVDRVGVENFQKVIYAIEEGTTKQLPKGLRGEAARFTQAMRKMLKDEQRAGVNVGDRTKVGDVVDYVKQLRVDDGKPRAGKAGGRKVDPDYAKSRSEGTIREKNAAEPGAYSEDLGQVYAQRASQSSRSVTSARLNQAVGRVGKKVSGSQPRRLTDNESFYRVDGSDLIKLNPKSAEAKVLENGWDAERKKLAARLAAQGKSPKQIRNALATAKQAVQGQHVVLNDKALERTVGTVAPAGERTTPGVFFDKAQGIWKIGATVVNPGYYVRNYVGEASNAYLKENPARLVKNAAVAGRALKEVSKKEEAARKGAKYKPGKHGDLIKKAEDVGAIRAGQYAREVGQLVSTESRKKGARLKGAGPIRRAARFRDNIEDQFRLASFKGGLDRGLKPDAAMARASKTHFDYGDLTKTERTVLRRVAPFYTFSARNIPLQIRMLLQRPGKFAQYEKLRQEFAKAFGFEDGWEQDLAEYEQRGAPVPFKWKGIDLTFSLGPSGLPLTDLNELPVGDEFAAEWMGRAASMVSPAIKSPVELWANFSFFFRDQLERDTSPLVPAPAWAQHLPNEIKKMSGLVPDFYNRKTGKYGWGWRAKADYLVNQVPGPAAFASRISKDSTRQGQSDALDTLAYLGPRIRPIDSAAVTINNLYDERDTIVKKQAALRQRNIKTGRVPKAAQKEFLTLKSRARVINGQIKQLQLELEAMPGHPDPGTSSLQDEIERRMSAPAKGPSSSALEDEVRKRLGG